MYKVAILGYRHQAKFHHAPAFAKNPDCEIVAVCDVVEERAKEGAETYGVPAYLDADEMLEREEIDIVDIPVGWAGLRRMEIDGAIGESIITGRPVKVDRYMPERGRTIFG